MPTNNLTEIVIYADKYDIFMFIHLIYCYHWKLDDFRKWPRLWMTLELTHVLEIECSVLRQFGKWAVGFVILTEEWCQQHMTITDAVAPVPVNGRDCSSSTGDLCSHVLYMSQHWLKTSVTNYIVYNIASCCFKHLVVANVSLESNLIFFLL